MGRDAFLYAYEPIKARSCVTDNICMHLFELAASMREVVEVGSWYGKSTHALLSGCDGTVYAVDHFQGSLHKADETFNASGKEEFFKNCGHFPNLVQMEMSSIEASKQFEDNSVDMVFIDAGHTYEEVLEDLRCWYPKVRILLCGHDFAMRPVRNALEEFGLEVNVPIGGMHWEHFKNASQQQTKGEGDVGEQGQEGDFHT